jgi:hypothetical protein
MSNTIYYVYAYLRSKDSQTAAAGTPYYIGYGKGQRAFNRHRIPVPKDRSNIIFLHENLSEDQAKELEIQEIARYGRKDLGTGILTNLTNGGEGVSGMVHSSETKKVMSEKKSGENNHFYGKKHSEEARKKISESKKGKPAPGNHRGKNHSEEAKQKLSEAVNRRSEEQKQSFAKCNLGKKKTEETKKKMSAAQIGENNPSYGTKWFHNPTTLETIRCISNDVPLGFIPGRIPK